MKRRGFIVSAVVTVLLIIIALWWFVPQKMSCIIDTEDITKIEIRHFGNSERSIVLSDQGLIKQFMNDLEKFSFKRRMGISKDGFDFDVILTHQDEKVDTLVISGEVAVNSTNYTCNGNVANMVWDWFNRYFVE